MRLSVLPAALLLCTAACNEPPKAPSAPTPGSQGAAPGSRPAAGAASNPSGEAANPHGDAFANAAPPGAPFTGLIKLDEGLGEAEVKPTDVLFIMARESQGGGLAGRLMAVQRQGGVQFPLRYEVGGKDVMVPGLPFAGPFIVLARLDRDGDPMTRGEDDLYGAFPQPVTAGQEGVHIVLKRGAPKTIPAPQGVRPPTALPAAPPTGAASQPAR